MFGETRCFGDSRPPQMTKFLEQCSFHTGCLAFWGDDKLHQTTQVYRDYNIGHFLRIIWGSLSNATSIIYELSQGGFSFSLLVMWLKKHIMLNGSMLNCFWICCFSGCWFQIFYIFDLTWGDDLIWQIFKQMGCKHQLLGCPRNLVNG